MNGGGLKGTRRLLVALLGLGVIGFTGTMGTYALFTASNNSLTNTVSSGTLLLADTTSFTSATTTLGLGATAPNQTGTDPRSLAECSATTVASTCSTLLKSVNVAAAGIEPGQYLRGTITIANSGTLPATIMMQVQNVKTNNGDNSLYGANGASGTSPCPSDVAGVASPGQTGAQLTTTSTAAGYQGTPVAISGCTDLGSALRISIQDAGANGTGAQCLFGNDTGGGSAGNDHLQAPVSGGFRSGSVSITTYSATGTKLGTGSGTCDDLSQTAVLGRPSSPVLPGSNPKDSFGTESSSAGNSSFAGLSGTNRVVIIPGGGSSHSVVSGTQLGGNLSGIPQWAPAETHVITVSIAMPNTGTTQVTDRNSNKYNVGNDNAYQGGAVSFDLYWFAVQ